MNRASARTIWTLLFNSTAVLLLGRAGWRALQARDFFFLSLFTILAAAYSAGLLMQISQHRVAPALNVRLQVAGVYLFTAFTTYVSVDDLMYMANANGSPFHGRWHTLFVISLIGSLLLAIASVSALVKPQYGHIAAVLGASLAWPYFAYVAWNLPWGDFRWLVTIQWDGELNVEAVLWLIVTTACSVASLANRPATATSIASPEMT